MKTLLNAIAVLVALEMHLLGGPLPREQVSSEAKWVLHFDADHYRTTKIGGFYVTNMLERTVADERAKHGFDFGPLLRSLKSATAYGTEYQKDSDENGVLLLKAGAAAVKGVEDFLVAQMTKDAKGTIQRLQAEPFALYQIDKEIVAAPLPGGALLLGKSRKHVQKAWEVVAGKQPNLTSTTAFSDLAKPSESFILAGADDLKENPALPPQAKILGQAESVRLALGERGDQLFLTLGLKTEDAKAAAQVKQLIDGLLAWASLEQTEDKDRQILLKSAKVTAVERMITAAFEYPVARVIEKMEQDARQNTAARK